MTHRVDAIVIGGGFYGCVLALYLKTQWALDKVILLETEDRLLGRASYVNQARVHQGYHYPRSFVTAHRSRVNFPRFLSDYASCIRSDFTKLYGIARRNSQVSARQFMRFCQEIGAPIRTARPSLRGLFQPHLVEQVFEVEECAFDAVILAELLRRDIHAAGVDVRFGHKATAIIPGSDHDMVVQPFGVAAPLILNCTYAGLTGLMPLHRRLKYEIAEIALIQMPQLLSELGITIMDGPFFSTMPFPSASMHSLTHVRYTPHQFWFSDAWPDVPPDVLLERAQQNTQAQLMLRDAMRFLPALSQATYQRSLFDIKVVLQASEVDDGRPILMETHPDHPGLMSILGGKIDNIYDILQEMDRIGSQAAHQ